MGFFGISQVSLSPGNLTLVWLPSGVGLIMCLILGRAALPWVLLSSFIINAPFLIQESQLNVVLYGFLPALMVAGADMAQSFLAWRMTRQLENRVKQPLLTQSTHMVPFFLFVCLLPPLATCWFLVSVTSFAAPETISLKLLLQQTLYITTSDTLGLLLVAPLYWAWQMQNSRPHAGFGLAGLKVLLPVAILLASFVWLPVLAIGVFPLLFILARRGCLMDTVVVTLAAAIVFSVGTANGVGLFGEHTGPKAFFELTVFMLAMVFVSYSASLTYGELRQHQANLQSLVEEQTGRLGERIKELNCLYELFRLTEKPGISSGELLQSLVEIIPPSWHYPEITCARIRLDSLEFKTKYFKETPWRQSSGIYINNEKRGVIEVFYLEQMPEIYEGPFLKEERYLINGIAKSLGHFFERKKAEVERRKSDKLRRAIIESSPLPIFTLNLEGRVLTWNSSAENILGWNAEEVIGKPLPIVPHNSKHEFETLMKRVTNEGGFTGLELVRQKKNGDLIDVSISTAPILDDNDEVIGIMASLEDITDRKKAEKNLHAIEWMLKSKNLENKSDYVPEYGDLSLLNENGLILSSIGKRQLRDIASEYLDLLETSAAVYERNGDYALGLFTSSWCQLMDASSRKLCNTPCNREALNSGKWLCHESCWKDAALKSIEEGKPVDIACHGGINMYSVPVRAGGNIIGAINFGYGDPPKDEATLEKLSQKYQVPIKDLRIQANAYQSRPQFIIDIAKRRLEKSATLIGYIIERKQAEEAVQNSEARFINLFNSIRDSILVADTNRIITQLNTAFTDLFGYSEDEVIGRETSLIYKDLNEYEEMGKKISDNINNPNFLLTVLYKKKNGEVFPGETNVSCLRNNRGEIEGFIGMIRDVTNERRIQKAVEESEAKYRSMFESMASASCVDELIYENDKPIDYRILDINPAFEQITGIGYNEAVGQLASVAYGTGKAPFLDVYSKVAETGKPAAFEAYFEPIQKYLYVTVGSPKPGCFSTVFNDITELKTAEADREKLQEQLIQSQKLESVGRLAGGVAHDFNNMLGVILGRTEMMLMKNRHNDPNYEDLMEIQKAAKRSTDLTRQLLAFARKQTIAPRVLNLNDTVDGTLKMLRRLIGEDIDLIWKPDADLWPINMDPSQIDQILANLCVNARDAISGTGTITIETENVEFDEAYCAIHADFVPGQYIMLAVSDDGHGIDNEMRGFIFEPFFTTKEMGKGTGLGLATVFGIVKQNNGLINVYSEPGHGTTFKIYIPKHEGAVSVTEESHQSDTPHGRGETILLVEDDKGISTIGKMMLETLGYYVVMANNPIEAVEYVRKYATPINLLITDVVMPQMNGKELAAEIKSLNPETKVLFMSGYTSNVIAHHGVLDENVNFIQKPFTIKAIANKVHEVLISE